MVLTSGFLLAGLAQPCMAVDAQGCWRNQMRCKEVVPRTTNDGIQKCRLVRDSVTIPVGAAQGGPKERGSLHMGVVRAKGM